MNHDQTVPPGLAVTLDHITYCDSSVFAVPAGRAIVAEDVFVAFFSADPPFLRWLMRVRDQLVRPFGLHRSESYRPQPLRPAQIGQRIGLFHVLAISDQQMVIGADDRHLDIRILLSVAGPAQFRLTTQVQVHNTLGRCYMAAILPLHRRLVPMMGRRISHWLAQS